MKLGSYETLKNIKEQQTKQKNSSMPEKQIAASVIEKTMIEVLKINKFETFLFFPHFKIFAKTFFLFRDKFESFCHKIRDVYLSLDASPHFFQLVKSDFKPFQQFLFSLKKSPLQPFSLKFFDLLEKTSSKDLLLLLKNF